MVTLMRLAQSLHLAGLSFPVDAMRQALAAVDQAATLAAEKARYRVEIWDKQTPLNGISAEQFLQREDVQAVGDGSIYLVYRDQCLVGFQPCDPDQLGFAPMTRDIALQRAAKQVELLAQPRADGIALQQVYAQLGLQ